MKNVLYEQSTPSIPVYGYQRKDYLAHHGILGQKWGIRRFQNEDGTLTEAGKERYRKLYERMEAAGPKSGFKKNKDGTLERNEQGYPIPFTNNKRNKRQIELNKYLYRLENNAKKMGAANPFEPDPVKNEEARKEYLEKNKETDKQIKERTHNLFLNQSNEKLLDYSIDVEDDTPAAQKMLKDFMSGKYNDKIYSAIADEFYPSYMERVNFVEPSFKTLYDSTNYEKPMTKSEFINKIRSCGINSGGIWNPFRNENEPLMSLYVNLFDWKKTSSNADWMPFGDHVAGIEIDKNGKIHGGVTMEG